jgi:hypothetical protein
MVELLVRARDERERAEDVKKNVEKEGHCGLENFSPFEHRVRGVRDLSKFRALCSLAIVS